MNWNKTLKKWVFVKLIVHPQVALGENLEPRSSVEHPLFLRLFSNVLALWFHSFDPVVSLVVSPKTQQAGPNFEFFHHRFLQFRPQKMSVGLDCPSLVFCCLLFLILKDPDCEHLKRAGNSAWSSHQLLHPEGFKAFTDPDYQASSSWALKNKVQDRSWLDKLLFPFLCIQHQRCGHMVSLLSKIFHHWPESQRR